MGNLEKGIDILQIDLPKLKDLNLGRVHGGEMDIRVECTEQQMIVTLNREGDAFVGRFVVAAITITIAFVVIVIFQSLDSVSDVLISQPRPMIWRRNIYHSLY